MGDGEKLLTHLNSALKVILGLHMFSHVPKKKLNFVVQCYMTKDTNTHSVLWCVHTVAALRMETLPSNPQTQKR